LALVLALPFRQEHRFIRRCTYAMSFTALKEAGVEPAKTDADQVRILRPLWVGSCRSPTEVTWTPPPTRGMFTLQVAPFCFNKWQQMPPLAIFAMPHHHLYYRYWRFFVP